MDEHIISRIMCHLDKQDLVRFSVVNKLAYHYSTHTNVNNRKCSEKHHNYHYTLSLLENARLSHCLCMLSSINELSSHIIPLSQYCINVTLRKCCGTTLKITLGCDIIINSIVYCYNDLLIIKDFDKCIITDKNKVVYIDNNKERLVHKLNSIISHKYVSKDVKIVNKITSDYQKGIVEQFYKDINKYFLCFF